METLKTFLIGVVGLIWKWVRLSSIAGLRKAYEWIVEDRDKIEACVRF